MAALRLLSFLLGVLVITSSHTAAVVPTAAAAANRRSLTPTTGHPRRQLSAATNTTAAIDPVLAKQWDILLAFRAQNAKCKVQYALNIKDWPTTRPKTPTGWPGATVKGNRIVAINFNNRGLCQFFPPSFSALTSLTSLDMSGNWQWDGPAMAWPPSWGALSRLTYLNLNGLRVKGKAPASWAAALKNLKVFKFAMPMNGPDLPAAWGPALTALTQMDFPDLAWPGNTSNTPGQKLVPASWAALKQLRTITIPCSALTTKPATNGIPFAPHITSLNVGMCGFESTTGGGQYLTQLHSLKHFINLPSLHLVSETIDYDFGLIDPGSFSLPPDWGALVKLTSLVISSTGWFGGRPQFLNGLRWQAILPPAWSSLTNLQRLVVDGRGWSWKFRNGPPASWNNLRALTHLELLSWVNDDGYGGFEPDDYPTTPGRVVPRTWGKLTRLRHLDLTDYGLTGMTLPSEWGAMRQLSVLRLSGNCVSGPMPATWGLLTNLMELSLPDQSTLPAICKTKKLTGALPNTWQHLRKVPSLQLSGHSLNGTLPTSWGGMVGLQTLRLQGNQLRGPIPASWSGIANITTLDLSHNKRLSGPLPLSFSSLKRLTYLDVSDNVFSGSVPPGPQWTSSGLWDRLSYVDLSKNAFSGKTPVKPKYAAYFNITGNKFVG